MFEGKTSLHDFCKVLEVEHEIFDEVKGENESVGGLMLELFSKIPRVSDNVSFKNFKFTIESVSTKRINRVKVDVQKLKNDAA